MDNPVMTQTMEVTTPKEVQTTEVVKPVVPDISLDPKDFQKEISKIAEEQGKQIVDGNVVDKTSEVSPATSQSSAPTAQITEEKPQIPEKFKTPDGQLDTAKVEKSTLNAEQALKQYLEKEVELRKKMNEVNNLQKQVQQTPQVAPQVPQQPMPQPGLAGLTADQVNAAIERSKNPGQVMLELAQLAAQAAYNQARQDTLTDVEQVNLKVEAQKRTQELQEIAQRDPWVFSPEGFNVLSSIRQTKPWLNNAPEPWKEAYNDYLGQKARQIPSQVQMPNPTAVAGSIKAPPTPVTAAARSEAPINVADLSKNPQKLNAFLNTLRPEQQSAFWQQLLGPRAK